MNSNIAAALSSALTNLDTKGRFKEPHELRGMIDSRIQQDIRWAVRVLEVVMENDGVATPRPVAHWVTYGKDQRAERYVNLLNLHAHGKLTHEERDYITRLALRFSKQAAARMLLNSI